MDTNVFVTAHRSYYPLDLCPGCWDGLIQHFRAGTLLSIDNVRDELLDASNTENEEPDALYFWTRSAPRDLFASTNQQPVVQIYRNVIAWVYSRPQFNDGAKDDFARKADGWLVAYAQAYDLTLVTQEVYRPLIKRRVPIPNVCSYFKVNYINTFDMLRQLGVRFELASSP